MKSAPFSIIEVFNSPEINFRGNTSAVVLLPQEWSEKNMQELAADFNQPATTFLWKENDSEKYNVRWFAPDAEIGLCGHGSLAAIVFLQNQSSSANIVLKSTQDEIRGKSEGNGWYRISMKPIPVVKDLDIPPALEKALGNSIDGYYGTDNKYIVLLESEEAVRKMKPDFEALRRIEVFGYAVTAAGENADFVSRTLVPHVRQLEDPATGSSHAALAPFWSQRLRKTEMTAHQLSSRGGLFRCRLDGKSVELGGRARVLATGNLKETPE